MTYAAYQLTRKPPPCFGQMPRRGQGLSVYPYLLDALRLRNEAVGTGRKITDPLEWARSDTIRIKQNQIGSEARSNPSSACYLKNRRSPPAQHMNGLF